MIPKDEYYLPEIAFTPEELGALLVAAQSGGENTRAEQAARKLLYGADGGVLAGLAGGPLASGSDARGALVLACRGRRAATPPRRGSATARRRARRRSGTVDAFAMVFRGGHWYLVGHDVERDDVRAFRLSRFTSDLDDLGEGAEPPEGFRAADHVQAGPWAATAEEHAEIAFAPEVAWWAVGSFAGAREVHASTTMGGSMSPSRWRTRALLASLVLQFGPDADVRSSRGPCVTRSSRRLEGVECLRRRARALRRPPSGSAGCS